MKPNHYLFTYLKVALILLLINSSYSACLSNQYLAADLSCQPCDTACLTCDGSTSSNCKTCTSTRTYDSVAGTCYCKDGYIQASPVIAQCVALVCSYKCSTCKTNTTFCVTCPSSSNRVLNSADGTCNCNSKYYDNGVSASCVACHYSCQQCNGNTASSCTSCNAANHRQTNGAGGCQCISKYYDVANTQVCGSCSYKCATCQTNSTNCLTCSPNRLTAPSCVCLNKFYDDGTTQSCLACHYSCKTCSSYSICTSCDATTAFRGLLVNTASSFCECLDGYFQDKSTQTYICSSCHVSCLQCGNSSATDCTACNSTANRRLNSTSCICKDGSYQPTPITQFCPLCDYRCKTCSISGTNCTSCESVLLRSLLINSCPCIQGYYQSLTTGLCVSCHSSCKACTNGTSCTLCDTTGKLYQLNSSNLCSCPDGMYFNSTFLICKTCSYSCVTCYNSATNCTSCGTNRTLSSNQCKCLPYHFDNGVDLFCAACHYSCQTCNGLLISNCLTCNSLDFRTYSSGKCVCNSGYYDDGSSKSCKTCLYSCKTCSNAISCDSCDTTKFRSNITANCPCYSNYYQNKTTLLCTKCSYYCLTCSDSITCLKCNTPNRQMNSTTLKCQCPIKFYDNGVNETCFSCLPECRTCTQASKCTSCDPTLFRTLTAVTKKCTCMNYYYDVAGTCTRCSYDCWTCSSSSTCLTCNSTANRIKNNSTNKCVCKSGYYDTGIEQCQKCSYACKQCSTSFTNCTLCDTSLRVFNNNWCDCSIQKYDNNSTMVCSQCQYTCKSCTNSTQCQACDNTKFRQFDSLSIRCECIVKYYDDLVNQLCKACSYKCQSCTNSSECLTCDNTKNRDYPSLMCPCINKFYDDGLNNQLCLACHYTCATCNKATQCLTCDSTNAFRKYHNPSKLCICQNGYFDDGNNNQICFSCDYTCATCIDSSLNCISCNTNVTHRSLTNTNECPCLSRYFDNNLDAECQSCNYTCQKCSDFDICDTCDITKQRQYNLTSGLCNCIEGYYDDLVNQNCPQCNLTCKSCTNSTACQTCDPSRFRNLNSSLDYRNISSLYCVCFYRYYSPNDSASCVHCHYSCEVCIGANNNNCQVCDNTKYRILNSTSHKCPCMSGYYDDGSNELCQPCHVSCATCFGPLQTQCKSCNITTFYMQNVTTCYVNCPDYHFNNLTNMVCTRCGSNCIYCIDSTQCTQCITSYHLLPTDTKCYLVCPDGWYQDSTNKICKLCPVGCKTCDSDVKCFDCISHYYFDTSLELCFECNQFCKDCIGPGQDQCLSCYEPLYYKSNKCHSLICPYGQYVDSMLGCKYCSDLYPNSLTCNKTQPFLCLPKFKLYNNECKKCSDVPGYHITKITNTCSQICGDGKLYDYQCDDGNTLNGDGCSSNCMIQQGWSCQLPIVNGFSVLGSISTCILQQELKMDLDYIYKYPGQNKIKLNFILSIKYRILNAFTITVTGVNSINYNWNMNQGQNLSQVSLIFNYNEHLHGKTVTIKYDQSNLNRRLLEEKIPRTDQVKKESRVLQVIINNIEFTTDIQVSTFPPVLYYSQQQIKLYQQFKNIIFISSLFLLILSLLIIPNKMGLHLLSFTYIPAKIFLIFGFAISSKTDWINYLLKDLKYTGLIGGVTLGQCCTNLNIFYQYKSELVSNTLFVVFAWVLIWIIQIGLYVYHKFVLAIPETIKYSNYMTVNFHTLIVFHLFFSTINTLYHYKIQNPIQAFNITLSIALSLFCLFLIILSWILTSYLKLSKHQFQNLDSKLNNFNNKSVDQDKEQFNKQNQMNQNQNNFQTQNTLSKNFSIISHNQNQQNQQNQNQHQITIEQENQHKTHQTYELTEQVQNIELKPMTKISFNFLLWDYISLYKPQYKLSKYYFPTTLTFLYFQAIIISLLQSINPFYFIVVETVIQIFYCFYLIILRPFKSKFTNFRLVFVQILFLSMEGIVGYHLYLSMDNKYLAMAQKIFMILCAATLIFSAFFCLLQHLISWRQQIWNIVQPCLISLRLRGTKKVLDFAPKYHRQNSIQVQQIEQNTGSKVDYDVFYQRVLKKQKVNKKYRKQRKMKEAIYKPY